jgi:hypothetical protein
MRKRIHIDGHSLVLTVTDAHVTIGNVSVARATLARLRSQLFNHSLNVSRSKTVVHNARLRIQNDLDSL